MSTDIVTQIRARLDAIAAERVSLDDEERRLRKALDALEPTTSVAPEAPMLGELGRERMKNIAEQLLSGIVPVVEIEYVRPAPCRGLINQQGPAH